MKKNPPSIDGLIPRRPGSQLGELHNVKHPERLVQGVDRSLHTGDNARDAAGLERSDKSIGRSDIDESLRQIDADPQAPPPKLTRRQKKELRRTSQQKPRSKVKRIIKWVLIALLVIVLGIGGYLGYKVLSAGNNIFSGSLFDFIKNEPLQEDSEGRSNFVIFGTAEDDEGGTHDGPNLTDSIMVVSVNQSQKTASMISLPRDLWVKHDNFCSVGYQEKLNTVYFCGSDNGEDEAAGAAAVQAKVGEILGLDIQYYVHINFSVVIQAVDAIGGVDVTIDSPDPRGIYDPNFDWKCNYRCHYVDYEDGEAVHLDGEHALALARARNAAGGYGLPGGNFDREKNQQMIGKAIRDKVVSAGTFTNLGTVTGLIDALGNNLRTNIQTKEIRTLMSLGNDIPSESITSLTLIEEDAPLVTTGSISLGTHDASIVRPIKGLFDYTDIHAYVAKNLSTNPIVREEAQVMVLNGSGVAGLATIEADKLKALGMLIADVSNAPAGTYAAAEVYQIAADKPASAAKLASYYGVTVKTTAPPVTVTGETDFVVIIGAARE